MISIVARRNAAQALGFNETFDVGVIFTLSTFFTGGSTESFVYFGVDGLGLCICLDGA